MVKIEKIRSILRIIYETTMDTKYDNIMQQTLDIDWFMIDRKGNIAHFASGGSILPESVAYSIENNETLHKYFSSIKESVEVIIHENNPKAKLTDSFAQMAEKGLFSFDVENAGEFASTNYVKVVSPKKPLNINELPTEIASILIKTQTKEIDFDSENSLDWRKVYRRTL